ncbi:MAG: Acidobacterial duplicated orphan permease (function unknown) [uncultured Cytophagales bacterium]|uniref:ABC transporter, permease protein n=1 Tax=uncultured Cytophagales bacterium TaxID=158755 RepID=A0A6J4KF84_9SPHI|nr:MAG: Acidobacterial duplicated orphan permease (function unknown) [uncultured Cytophagales bacterium]
MLRNYLNIALRNLLRNKAFSLINILGLSIGMASAILILLWIGNEVSHDRFHAKGDRIYTLNNRDHFNGELHAWNSTPKILVPTVRQDYPEVEEAVRFDGTEFLFTYGDKKLNVPGSFVDPGFLTVFSFPLRQGNAGTALAGTNNIVVTEKLARKLFGDEEPMGKIVRIDTTDYLTVTGVLADLPNNTHFNFEYLMSWAYMTKLDWDDKSWDNNSVRSYVLLKPGVSQAAFDAKIKNITIDHTSGATKSTTQVFTHRFADAYLYTRSENGQYVGGRIERVRLFSLIAGLILLIACINFMNLSTARSEKRAKEVGIRKVVGASKEKLVGQFLGESILLAFLAGVVALAGVGLALPAFNGLVDKELYLDLTNPLFWGAGLLFGLLTGVVAGVYPAFFLSAANPALVLKGGGARNASKAARTLVTPRKVLVIVQFTFAIVLIICTIIITQQINFAQQRDTGYAKDKLVYVHLQGDIKKHYESIKSELLNSGAAVAVTKSMSPITQRYSDGWGFSWTGSTKEDEKTDFIRMAADADFVKTMGVTLLQGRDIDIKKFPSDSTAVLLNEASVKAMRFKDPIGQIVKEGDRQWHVVGVIRDFIYESPYEKVGQLMVFGPASWFNVMHVKLNPAKPVARSLQGVGGVFRQFNPQYPFEYQFVDEAYARKFDDQKRIGKLAALFAALTIFISCLGLFGLSAYMAQNRVKEIGVRRVLGASVGGIAALLSKDFLKLVVVAMLIATPLAWWAMHAWLQVFEYRVAIQWWVFAVAGTASVLIALATVGYQAVKAATANPVRSLRAE